MIPPRRFSIFLQFFLVLTIPDDKRAEFSLPSARQQLLVCTPQCPASFTTEEMQTPVFKATFICYPFFGRSLIPPHRINLSVSVLPQHFLSSHCIGLLVCQSPPVDSFRIVIPSVTATKLVLTRGWLCQNDFVSHS